MHPVLPRMIIANAISVKTLMREFHLPPHWKLCFRKLIYYQKISASQRKVVEACTVKCSIAVIYSFWTGPLHHPNVSRYCCTRSPPAENFNFLIYLIFNISFDSAHFHCWAFSRAFLDLGIRCVRHKFDVMVIFASIQEILSLHKWWILVFRLLVSFKCFSHFIKWKLYPAFLLLLLLELELNTILCLPYND